MKISKSRKIAILGAVLAIVALVAVVVLANPSCPGKVIDDAGPAE